MSKVSIEYAHIYTNQHISDEHETSLEILEQVKSNMRDAGHEVSLVVMVDDYSFPDPSFDYVTFSQWLEAQGHKPDLMIRESQLIPVCDQVLGIIKDEKLKNQLVDYIKAKKYPCSLFIAAWYLLRLGKLQSPLFAANNIADELFNILPESFNPFEDKGLEIIAATPYGEVVDKIKYKFLPGRLIA